MRLDEPRRVPLGERLSFAEARLWQAEQEHGDTTAFVECPRHVPLVVRLAGPVDTARLAACIETVAEEQEILRSRLVERDGQPVREIASSSGVTTSVADLSALSSTALDAAVAASLLEEVNRPFDLRRGPLIRASILTLDRRTHVVALVLHHVVADGWSKHVLGRQLAAAYAQGAHGTAEQAAPAAGYGDYVHRQQELADSDRGEVLMNYWSARLAGAPHVVLPGDRRQTADSSTSGSVVRFAVPPEWADAFRRLARQIGATPSVAMMTLFKVVLQRVTGIADLVVGMPASDRNAPEFDNVVGVFLNLVMLRTDLSGNPTFAEAVRRVRGTFRDAYDYSDIPHALVQTVLRREHGRAFPLRFVFNYASARTGAALVLPDTAAENMTVDVNAPSCADLSVHMFDRAGTITGFVLYKTEQFSERYIGSLLDHFQTLLREVVGEPERRISDYLAGRETLESVRQAAGWAMGAAGAARR